MTFSTQDLTSNRSFSGLAFIFLYFALTPVHAQIYQQEQQEQQETRYIKNHNKEGINNSKFKQLDEILPTPNIYRTASGAPGHKYWQQRVDYKIAIILDDKTQQVSGTETLSYTNNSPDVLNKVFYHLYFNAFQPNSQMDVRSRNIQDPDRRVGDRISKLSSSEIGSSKISSTVPKP